MKIFFFIYLIILKFYIYLNNNFETKYCSPQKFFNEIVLKNMKKEQQFKDKLNFAEKIRNDYLITNPSEKNDKSSTLSVTKLDKFKSVNAVELNIYDISFTFFVSKLLKIKLFNDDDL